MAPDGAGLEAVIVLSQSPQKQKKTVHLHSVQPRFSTSLAPIGRRPIETSAEPQRQASGNPRRLAVRVQGVCECDIALPLREVITQCD